MVLGLTRTNNRLKTGYLCKAGENHVPWPPWATTSADDVRQLLPLDQRGPWQDNLACSQSSSVHDLAPAGSHPAEPPHFFYCRAHLEAIRRTHGTTRPWPARDQGLCVTCGEPAERKPVTMVAPSPASSPNAPAPPSPGSSRIAVAEVATPAVPIASRGAEVEFAERPAGSAGFSGGEADTPICGRRAQWGECKKPLSARMVSGPVAPA